MYRSSYQHGLLSVLFSGGSNPLGIWEITKSKDGYIERFLDKDIKAMVIQIGGSNVSTTFLSCPRGKQVLGISMPFLVMIVKNLNKYFVFEITILDDSNTRRRFRMANFQSTTQINPQSTVMPLHLSDGWNQIQFNLVEFTRRAYNKQFIEVQKIRINANIRIRRIYCTERILSEEELPPEYKLYLPIQSKKKGKGKENQQQQSKLDTKVAKSDNGSGMQVNLVAAVAPPEGVNTEGEPTEIAKVEEAELEGVRAESTAGESALDKVEEEKEKPIADETPASEVQSLPEGETPEVEDMAGETPEVNPTGPDLTEPTEPAELEAIDEAPPSGE